MGKQILCVLAVFALVQSGLGLKCISCDSARNQNCNDPAKVDVLAVSECNPPPRSADIAVGNCLKMKTEDKTTGLVNITRKCMITPKDGDICKIASAAFDFARIEVEHCSTCDSDLCNSASQYLPSMFALFAVLLANIYFRA